MQHGRPVGQETSTMGASGEIIRFFHSDYSYASLMVYHANAMKFASLVDGDAKAWLTTSPIIKMWTVCWRLRSWSTYISALIESDELYLSTFRRRERWMPNMMLLWTAEVKMGWIINDEDLLVISGIVDSCLRYYQIEKYSQKSWSRVYLIIKSSHSKPHRIHNPHGNSLNEKYTEKQH